MSRKSQQRYVEQTLEKPPVRSDFRIRYSAFPEEKKIPLYTLSLH